MAWSIVGTFLSTVIYVEAAPTALAHIQWKYYIIFIVLTAVNIAILYLWCPEVNVFQCPQRKTAANSTKTQTKGLSLEEINGKFGDEVVVHFADATEKQRANLEAMMSAERHHGAGTMKTGGAAEMEAESAGARELAG